MTKLSEAKRIVDAIMRKISNTKMESSHCCGTNMVYPASLARSYEHTTEGIYIDLYTDNLRFDGEDDSDSNDEVLELNLQKHFLAALKNYKDIEFVSFSISDNGHWPVVLKFKADKPAYKKLKLLLEKVYNHQDKIRQFNIEFVKKLKDQTSKTKTCKNCKSSLTITSIRSHCCPVCNAPLYSETEKKKVQKIEDKISGFKVQISELLK